MLVPILVGLGVTLVVGAIQKASSTSETPNTDKAPDANKAPRKKETAAEAFARGEKLGAKKASDEFTAKQAADKAERERIAAIAREVAGQSQTSSGKAN